MEWGFSNAENHILKLSNSWNYWKFGEISSIGQLDVIRNSGVLKTWFDQDVWKVWGLKPLSEQYGSGFAKILSRNRWSCPENWTYRPNQFVPHQGRLHITAHPRSKGHLLTPALKEIRRTRTQRLLQWHAENGYENTLFTDEKFLPSRNSRTTRTTKFVFKRPLRCILRGQGCSHASYVLVCWQMSHQRVTYLRFCKKELTLVSICIKRTCYKEWCNSMTWPSSVVRNWFSSRIQFLPQSQDDSGVAADESSGNYRRRGLVLGESRPQPPGLKIVGSFGRTWLSRNVITTWTVWRDSSWKQRHRTPSRRCVPR